MSVIFAAPGNDCMRQCHLYRSFAKSTATFNHFGIGGWYTRLVSVLSRKQLSMDFSSVDGPTQVGESNSIQAGRGELQDSTKVFRHPSWTLPFIVRLGEALGSYYILFRRSRPAAHDLSTRLHSTGDHRGYPSLGNNSAFPLLSR